MDVTCEKCRAEYEFDETLLGERGATVKCSSCQHVFRVQPRERPARGALKLRFARTGQVEGIGSLRELQQRIAEGEVSADDQLGRDGFAFRRLGDVPELKNFFTLPPGPHAGGPRHAPTPLSVSETSMPPSSKNDPRTGAPAQAAVRAPDPGKRTMLGVGPLNPHIPPPPRMPNVPGALPSAARTITDPARPRSAPISSIPTAPQAETPSAQGMRAPVSGMPTAPNVRAPRLPSDAPAIARPPGETPRTFDSESAATPGVKLYLSDDEAPPARATARGSRTGLYALLVVVLGGAGWIGMNAMGGSGESTSAPAASAASPAAEAPSPAPSEPGAASAPMAGAPHAAGEAPEAVKPSDAQQAPPPAQPQDKAKAAAAAKPAKEPPKEPAQAQKETKAEKRAKEAKEARAAQPEPREAAIRDPSDYNGWVTRGDQYFARGDMQGARTAYENALSVRPSGSEANTGLGFTLLASNRAREAIPHFDRAAHAGYAEASIGLGDAYRKLGQKSSAMEAYESYLVRLPTGSKAQYARNQVSSLKGSARAEQPKEPAAAPPNDDYRPAGEFAPAPAPSEESDE